MITSYFKPDKPIVKKYEYFELYSSFFKINQFRPLYSEISENLVVNSGRKSLVCVDLKHRDNFNIYNLPLMEWTPIINGIKTKIENDNPSNEINYGLVHYYHDEHATINWHSDREALRSNIYSVSIGGTRRFCLKEKSSGKIYSFDLNDGDLFIMKPGCQDKFEHCIKSIKKYSEPRISITFRKIESVFQNFVFNPDSLMVFLDKTPFHRITSTKQGVNICLDKDDINELDVFEINNIISSKNASILKSNLQKAIRRNEKSIALNTCLKMLRDNMVIELLRRLTIITFEDVVINKYYPIIVWYYIVVSSSNSYKLTNFDAKFIYSYVSHLCDISNNYIPKTAKEILPLSILIEDPILLSLYLRIQYGGFKGEIKYMNDLIYDIKNGIHEINVDDIILIKIPSKNNVLIMDCAIDFHCFPNMINKVLGRIDEKYGFTEEDIKKFIWDFDSSINYRIDVEHSSERELQWLKIVKPKCNIYRRFIKKMVDI